MSLDLGISNFEIEKIINSSQIEDLKIILSVFFLLIK